LRTIIATVVAGALAVAVTVGVLASLASVQGARSDDLATSRVSPTEALLEPTRPADRPCRSSLQAEIDAAVAGAAIDLEGCTFTGGATIEKPIAISGGVLRLPAGEAGIVVVADDVTIERMTIVGAQSTTYVFEEIGILVQATPEDPVRRLTIRDTTIGNLGGYGTYLRNVADVHIERNDVRDIVYAGLMVLSGIDGTIQENAVRRIGVRGSEANGGNAYGIALTLRGDREPASSGFVVHGNLVEDVPTWHAIDTHGGNTIVFSGNTVRRSMRGIFLTTDEAGNEPTNITIVDNQLLSPAPVATNLAAITLYRARKVAIVDNYVVGWGEGRFLNDFEERSTRVVVTGNSVEP
jgi:hypothetical protein